MSLLEQGIGLGHLQRCLPVSSILWDAVSSQTTLQMLLSHLAAPGAADPNSPEQKTQLAGTKLPIRAIVIYTDFCSQYQTTGGCGCCHTGTAVSGPGNSYSRQSCCGASGCPWKGFSGQCHREGTLQLSAVAQVQLLRGICSLLPVLRMQVYDPGSLLPVLNVISINSVPSFSFLFFLEISLGCQKRSSN